MARHRVDRGAVVSPDEKAHHMAEILRLDGELTKARAEIKRLRDAYLVVDRIVDNALHPNRTPSSRDTDS